MTLEMTLVANDFRILSSENLRRALPIVLTPFTENQATAAPWAAFGNSGVSISVSTTTS